LACRLRLPQPGFDETEELNGETGKKSVQPNQFDQAILTGAKLGLLLESRNCFKPEWFVQGST
jgi:hypothetical protein